MKVLVKPDRQRTIAQASADPLTYRAGHDSLQAHGGLRGDRMRKSARVPADLIAHLDGPGSAVRRTPGDPTGAGGRGIQQQRRRRPMFGILSQHAAQQVSHEAADAVVADQRGVAALIQLPRDDLRVGLSGQRRSPERQGEHQHPEGIDIVRNGALAPTARQAD